jgi:hypothetical protein
MLVMLVTHGYAVMSPVPLDFALFRHAAIAALHGQNVYAAVPGLAYPLPGMLLVTPWTPLPDALASAAFMLLSASAFAWALMAQGYAPLLGFFTPGMLFAAQVGQWSPMFAGAFAIAPLGIFLIVKPHIGFAFFVARPRWWAVASAVICTSLAFALQPTWVHDWRASMAMGGAHLGTEGKGNYQYVPPIMLPGGVLTLVALSRWRRPEARLLVALACVPQSLHLYEIVPLALVPRGWRQSAGYLVLSHVVWRLLGNHTPYANYVAYTTASGKLYTLLIILPLAAMVLLRPNEGTLPAWIESRLENVPLWIRGRPATE